MAQALDGGEIQQGDTEYLFVAFDNRVNLAVDHPLKASGFQTSGYTVRLVAKLAKTDDDADAIISLDLTATNEDIAAGELEPADTKNLDVGVLGLELFFQVQVSNGAQVFTVVRNGRFTITKDVIIEG